MKQTLLTAIFSLSFLSCFSQVQEVMIVEKADGSTEEINVNDIKRVTFGSLYVNPAGSVAEAIDLGLPSGVKWASWNLGATKASEYGGYYGWADATGTQTSIDVNDYPNENPPSEISGTQYDIAKKLWGGEWRLPTYDDITEIYEQCHWYKSDDCIEVVGPNGNSIMLPMAGSREGAEIYDTVNYGYYWSGTLYKDDNNIAWLMNIDMKNGKYGLAAGSRYFGLSVRPVFGTPISISVSTGNATNITENGATLAGKIEGVKTAITTGFIYDTSNRLSSTNGTKKTTTASSDFTITLSELNASTTYYYCAYAEMDGKYYYGEVKSFTTKEKPTKGTLNGHDWVDLGLPSGIKWATCNIGASSSMAAGSYFAWGETHTKTKYAESTYSVSNIKRDISGTSYDAAHVIWGSDWRLPTNKEIEELCQYCYWEWINTGYSKGYRILGSNGNSIFLPAAGFYAFDDGFLYAKIELEGYGTYGYYWGGTYGGTNDWGYQFGTMIAFDSGSKGILSSARGYWGCPIRAVCP